MLRFISAILLCLLCSLNALAMMISDEGPTEENNAGFCPQSYDELGAGYTIYLDHICITLEERIYQINDHVMFPLREIIEKLAGPRYGYNVFVTYTPDDKVAWIETPSQMVGFPADQHWIFWDGKIAPVTTGAVIIHDRMRLPLRTLIEKLGGTIDWHEETRTIQIALHHWHPLLTDHLSCSIHGYSDFDSCDPSTFFLPRTYRTWGHAFVRDVIRQGLANPNTISHMNRVGLDKNGSPLQADLDWWGATVSTTEQVLTDIWLASMFQHLLVRTEVVPKARNPIIGSPVTFGAAAPTRNGLEWVNRNGMSLHAARFQARAANTTFEFRSGMLHVQEYGYKGIWFDGPPQVLDDGIRIFVEAKSDAGFFARMIKTPGFNRNAWEEAILKEFRTQAKVLEGEYAILDVRVETELLAESIEEVIRRHAPELFEVLRVTVFP